MGNYLDCLDSLLEYMRNYQAILTRINLITKDINYLSKEKIYEELKKIQDDFK
jgi:hypothetical protein